MFRRADMGGKACGRARERQCRVPQSESVRFGGCVDSACIRLSSFFARRSVLVLLVMSDEEQTRAGEKEEDGEGMPISASSSMVPVKDNKGSVQEERQRAVARSL